MKIALLTAGGVGNRMNQEIPKQFMYINDKPLIIYAMEAFQKASEIDVIAVVCLEGWESVLTAYAKQYHIDKFKHIIAPGKTGQESIKNGLFMLKEIYKEDDIILVHDGVRPLVSQDLISDCLVVTEKYGNAIASIPTVEAILYSEDGLESTQYYDREKLQRTQTPHGFYLGDLVKLHEEALEKGITNSVASCTLAIELGREVHFSLGSEKNLKITTRDDIDIFKALLLLQGK